MEAKIVRSKRCDYCPMRGKPRYRERAIWMVKVTVEFLSLIADAPRIVCPDCLTWLRSLLKNPKNRERAFTYRGYRLRVKTVRYDDEGFREVP